MKKSDYICLFLSIIINIGIILALTVFSKDTQEILDAEQIKIGLVAVENDASTKFRGEKNVDAKKQNLDADSIEKKAEEDKKQEEKPVEKPEEKPVEKPQGKQLPQTGDSNIPVEAGLLTLATGIALARTRRKEKESK